MTTTEALTTFTVPADEQNNSTLSFFNYYNPGTPFDIAMDFLLVFALLLALYLLVVLSYYECSLEKATNTKASTAPKKSKYKDIGTWLRILCILSALFALLRCVNDIFYYKTTTMSDIPCTLLKNMGVSWLFEVDTTVYLFLWLRQRVLYRKRSMQRLSSPIIQVLSWVALGLIIAIFLVMNILLAWRTYHYNPEKAKCKQIPNPVGPVFHKIFLGGSSFLHVILVGLYIYPLLRQSVRLEKRRRSSAIPTPENQGTSTMLNRDSAATGRSSLMGVVVRCVIISLYCVLTDGLVIILAEYVFSEGYQTKLRHFLYNLNVVLNAFAIVVSFKNWNVMLFPCKSTDATQQNNSPKRDSQTASTVMSTNVTNRESI